MILYRIRPKLLFVLTKSIARYNTLKLPQTNPHKPITNNLNSFTQIKGMASKTAESDPNEVVEQDVLSVSELGEGAMREVELSNGYKLLLVNHEGNISALASKCTHYGAPLIKGDKVGCTIRCPWHGACFNAVTGDIEDYPGLDSLRKYETHIVDGKIRVKTSVAELTQGKRVKGMATPSPKNLNVVLLVGGGPASVTCAETLRQEGYDGRIVMACKEKVLPYDRPKGSKAMTSSHSNIALRSAEFYEKNGIQVLLGKEVVGVDVDKKEATFNDGSRQKYDQVLLAPGSQCRTLPIPGNDLPGLFTLRTIEEANEIYKAATNKTVAIVGASFIGMEVASCLANVAKSVTAIEYLPQPFFALGKEVGIALKKFCMGKGIKFELDVRVTEYVSEGGQLKGVKLSEGNIIPCDIAIVAVGVRPSTDFLKGSGIPLNKDGSVTTNEFLAVKPDVFAAGDIALFPSPLGHGEPVRIEHWQIAHYLGRVAAKNILKKPTPVDTVPYFWTVLFGKSVRYCGYSRGYEKFVYEGDFETPKFVGYYLKSDKVVAVVSLDSDPKVSEYANKMKMGQFPTFDELKQTAELHEQ